MFKRPKARPDELDATTRQTIRTILFTMPFVEHMRQAHGMSDDEIFSSCLELIHGGFIRLVCDDDAVRLELSPEFLPQEWGHA